MYYLLWGAVCVKIRTYVDFVNDARIYFISTIFNKYRRYLVNIDDLYVA